MLKYQIHKLSKGGKEARSVLLEDILTSDVFGLMYYLPYDSLLKPFLEYASTINPYSNFSTPSTEPSIDFWRTINWPKTIPRLGRKAIEPDVIMEWDDVILFIEAKFVSAADPKELLRELLAGIYHASNQKRFFMLLIDKNLSPPIIFSKEDSSRMSILEYLKRRLKELKYPNNIANRVSNYFLWINWQSVYSLAKKLLNSESDLLVKKILKDLIEILERKGLTPFEKLSLENFGDMLIDVSSLGEIGLQIRKIYSDLSDFCIDLELFNKIGILKNDPLTFVCQFDINKNYFDYLTLGKNYEGR